MVPDAGAPPEVLIVNPPTKKGGHAAAVEDPPRDVGAGPSPDDDAGASASGTPGCVPEGGVDEPDDDFVDSNCDGIDGDVTAAVFVATAGADTADGTMANPVQTLKRGIALALAAGKSVYVCDGQYAEAVVMDGGGVNLYGGYACTRNWQRERDLATLKPASGVPLTVTNMTAAPIVVDRFAFRAADGTGDGASSVAASVVGSKQIRFRNVLFAAGNATNGTSGATVPDPMWSTQEAASDAIELGIASICSSSSDFELSASSDRKCRSIAFGAYGATRACPDHTRVEGGSGGNGGNWWEMDPDGWPGEDGTPSSGAALDGDPGDPGNAGTAASSGFGTLQNGTYLTTNSGLDGTDGQHGQSGKGGSGGASPGNNSGGAVLTFYPGGGGGQGGYAGCPGTGGKRGLGGGGSLGLIAVDTVVLVEQSTIQTGHGGDGGAGSDGAPGQRGGKGGKGAPATDAYDFGSGGDGGKGGDGGHGGAGGPGGGGPSIGMVWSGTEPTTMLVTYALGTPGRGGASVDATAPDGVGAESISYQQIGSAGQ
jgi:hypothetical protein